MDVRLPTALRLQQVPIGALFVLVHASKGNGICLRATFDASSDDDDDHRVVPISWPGEPTSVGIPIYLSALNGDAVVLEDARVEVNPLSANAAPTGSLTAVYCRDGKLFFPLRDNGRLGGLVDAATGEIQDNLRGHFVAFDEWSITVEDDSPERKKIYQINNSGEG